MLRNQMIKLSISAVVGLIVGILLAETFGWLAVLILPFYAIGTVYAIRHVLRICGAILQWFFGLLGLSVGTFNILGCLFGFLLMLFALALTLSVTWVAGIIICIVDIIRAAREDAAFGTPAQPADNAPARELPWKNKKRLPASTSDPNDPWGMD